VGCAYSPEANVAAFNFRNMPVVIESKKIMIYNAENEAEAQVVVDWLKDILITAIET
jgi:hypothetical protein